jgi:hypothetical protein
VKADEGKGTKKRSLKKRAREEGKKNTRRKKRK